MFTRIVSMQLKPNTHREFIEKFEKEIVPTLKKQKGFKDQMLFVVPGGRKWSQSACGTRKRTPRPTIAPPTHKC